MGKATVVGAVSGAISFGIGSVASSITVGKAIFQAGAHGMLGGTMSLLDGGDFGSGFLSGMVSSIISSGLQWININNIILKKAVMIAGGGLSGGISSSISGGDFWAGARQGLITSGLNHAMHAVFGKTKNNNYGDDCDDCKLKGGEYDGISFSEIEEGRIGWGVVGSSSISKHKFSNSEFHDFMIKNKSEYAAITNTLSASKNSIYALGLVSSYIKKLLGTGWGAGLNVQLSINTEKYKMLSNNYQNVLNSYYKLHSDATPNLRGVYMITVHRTSTNMYFTTGSIVHHFYDVFSLNHLGTIVGAFY